MTDEFQERYLSDRSRAMATIILTRRDDLTIVATRNETGLDLHVSIEREDKPMRLMFGVLLRGSASTVAVEQANRILGPTLAQFRGMRKFTYPVCLFLFTMREDQAFFSWLAEPVISEGAPKLVHRDEAHCVELTDQLLDRVIEQMVAWYDVVESVLIA